VVIKKQFSKKGGELMRYLVLFLAVGAVFGLVACSQAVIDDLISRYITIFTSKVAGSGFYLGKGYFVTVNHVFYDSLGNYNDSTEIIAINFKGFGGAKIVKKDNKFTVCKMDWYNEGDFWDSFDKPVLGTFVFWIAPYNVNDNIILAVKGGIVSALNSESFLVQADVLPGASGSAVFDGNGNLLGLIESLFIVESTTPANGKIINTFIEVKKINKSILDGL